MADPGTAQRHQLLDRHFRWRSSGVSRLEGLSDAVFAIVLALLFLRSAPPANFDDLMATMKSLLPFAAMFAIVAYVWVELWLFSRRYDLRDGWTIFLQLVLLFLLLFYAYPLKFLFTLLMVQLFGPIGAQTTESMQGSGIDLRMLFTIYGIGYGAIFSVLALLYARALALADSLELDDIERFLTRSGVFECLVQVAIAMASVVLAVTGVGLRFGLCGWLYACIGPILAVHGVWQARRLRALTAA